MVERFLKLIENSLLIFFCICKLGNRYVQMNSVVD